MEAAVTAAGVRSESRNFYVWMAGTFVLVAFAGFTPTYWAKVAAGTFHAAPIIHMHGMLLFAWTCFFFIQTALVASGRTLDHRAWGLAGISLFTFMMCSILVGEATVLKRDEALGFGDASRRFAAVTLCAWPLMAAMFTLAIVNIRKPQVHKRLMLLLMVGIMTPAIARVFITFFAPPGLAGPPLPFVSIPPGLVADLLLVAHARPASSGLCLWRVGSRCRTSGSRGALCNAGLDAHCEGVSRPGGLGAPSSASPPERLAPSRPRESPAHRHRPCAVFDASD
jgi:hypothetical protein